MVNKPVFAATITATSTRDQINNMNAGRMRQNELAKSGGGVTVPQFQTSGLSAGPNANTHIAGMASQQLQANAQNEYAGCVGKPAGSSCNKGGRRRSRRRTRRRRSRQHKVK